jgi:hypothetical protein
MKPGHLTAVAAFANAHPRLVQGTACGLLAVVAALVIYGLLSILRLAGMSPL